MLLNPLQDTPNPPPLFSLKFSLYLSSCSNPLACTQLGKTSWLDRWSDLDWSKFYPCWFMVDAWMEGHFWNHAWQLDLQNIPSMAKLSQILTVRSYSIVINKYFWVVDRWSGSTAISLDSDHGSHHQIDDQMIKFSLWLVAFYHFVAIHFNLDLATNFLSLLSLPSCRDPSVKTWFEKIIRKKSLSTLMLASLSSCRDASARNQSASP